MTSAADGPRPIKDNTKVNGLLATMVTLALFLGAIAIWFFAGELVCQIIGDPDDPMCASPIGRYTLPSTLGLVLFGAMAGISFVAYHAFKAARSAVLEYITDKWQR